MNRINSPERRDMVDLRRLLSWLENVFQNEGGSADTIYLSDEVVQDVKSLMNSSWWKVRGILDELGLLHPLLNLLKGYRIVPPVSRRSSDPFISYPSTSGRGIYSAHSKTAASRRAGEKALSEAQLFDLISSFLRAIASPEPGTERFTVFRRYPPQERLKLRAVGTLWVVREVKSGDETGTTGIKIIFEPIKHRSMRQPNNKNQAAPLEPVPTAV